MRLVPLPLLFATLLLTPLPRAHAEDAPAGLPYNRVNLMMKLLKSHRIKEVDCVAWYVKDSRKDHVLDPATAKFRVRTREGVEIPLEVEALNKVPADQLKDYEKKMIEDDGLTHRLWIPKNDKRMADGSIVHSLPKGVVSMVQGIGIASKAADKEDKAGAEDKVPAAEEPGPGRPAKP